MKIVHINAFSNYGGADSQCEWLVKALQVSGVLQRVIAGGQGDRIQRLRAAGVDVVEADLPGRVGFFARRRLEAEIARFTPDLVVSWRPEVSAIVPRGGFPHLGRMPATFDAKAYITADALLASSKPRADAAIAAGWASDKVNVIPNVSSSVNHRDDVEAADRRRLFTPATARIVFSSGRLEKSKSFDVLIDAVARMSSVYLWIAGDGPDRAFFEDYAYAKGMKPRVRFLGWVDDLRPYFKASDVYAYPAGNEDLGDAVVEAWSEGMPVIAADSIGPGLLIRHQENGVLVPVNDAPAMADAIRWLLADSAAAARLGQAGRATFMEDHAPEKIVARYIDLFNRLCARGDAPASSALG